MLNEINSVSFESDFKEEEECLSLFLNSKKIEFPLSSESTNLKPSSTWLRAKHKNNSVHEPGMLKIMLLLREKEFDIRNIIDIGSLYGYFSKISSHLFEKAEIHAIEANFLSFEILQENIKKDTNIHAHFLGMSDVTEKSLKIIYGFGIIDFTLRNFIYYGMRNFIKFCLGRIKNPLINIVNLKQSRLSSFCSINNLKPDLIKIDVEGYQAKILPPDYEFIIDNMPIILLELDSPEKLRQFDQTNFTIIKPLLANGYSMYWGDHRNNLEKFIEVNIKEIESKKINIERNSLAILIPTNKIK